MIDLVLAIFFSLDYDTIMERSFDTELNFIPSTLSILITAQNTAGMMASLALRGFFLWFLNLGICVYLFTQTFKVYDHNRMSPLNATATRSGKVNNGFKNDNELQGHPIYKNQPISAFENQ
jgi:uncharacterized membrane protein